MLNNQQFSGSILAARYAFMPNKLRYCGGDNNSELFSYVANQQTDVGLQELLKEFETMYPYLRLIADANKIADPFNYRVVEAYWIGNDLLENVSMQNFYRYLVDGQKLKKKLKPSLVEKVFGKIPLGAKPHHSFHVLNIPKRTGYYPVEHTLKTMDECRIAGAKIKNKPASPVGGNSKIKNDFISGVTVEYRPLISVNNKLTLGQPVERDVWTEINDKAFVKDLNIGDFVSIHWGWVCDALTEVQAKNLEKWTKYNLTLANFAI